MLSTISIPLGYKRRQKNLINAALVIIGLNNYKRIHIRPPAPSFMIF